MHGGEIPQLLRRFVHRDLVSDGCVFEQRLDVGRDQPVERDAILERELAQHRAGFGPVVTGPVLEV